jgi:hypothetical protein
MSEMPDTHHEGNTIQRLDRLEAKVDDLACKVTDLSTTEAVRRAEDRALPERVRRLEDTVLVWDTRWKTITALLVGVFGASIISALGVIMGLFK